MSTELYDYYLENSGPPLPEGYSFHIYKEDFDGPWEFTFAIRAPKKWWQRRGTKQGLSSSRWLDHKRYHVTEKQQRTGEPPPVEWFASVLLEVYGYWRAVTYEDDMRVGWNAYLGEHP